MYMLNIIAGFTDKVIYPAFQAEWLGKDMPDSVMLLLEIGDVILPSRVLALSHKNPDVGRSMIKSDLEHADFFKRAPVRDWFSENSHRFPATASYMCHLDLVRHLCLEVLGDQNPEARNT